MRARTVLRVIPSTAAVREMFQPVCCRTARMCSRRASSSDRGAGTTDVGGAASSRTGAGSSSTSAVTTAPSVSSATRSSTLLSSRTLPGHGCARSRSWASGDSVFRGRP